jgi:hypothetical protein
LCTPAYQAQVWSPVDRKPSRKTAGALDALCLGYSWAFGDGSGALGQDASHASPGSYTAAGTVADSSGGDSAAITVTKRETTSVYIGPNQSTPSKTLARSGTLTDELGQPGRR